MKTLVLAFAAASLTAGVALADNAAIDSDDNSIYNVLPQAERTVGSTFGGSAKVELGASVNAIDSDDNAIYNVSAQPVKERALGSTFGGFKPVKLGVSVNAIDSDDNQIYNVR